MPLLLVGVTNPSELLSGFVVRVTYASLSRADKITLEVADSDHLELRLVTKCDTANGRKSAQIQVAVETYSREED